MNRIDRDPRRGLARKLALLLAAAAAACEPLPPSPDVRGPRDGRSSTAAHPAPSATRELMWIRRGRIITLTKTEHVCESDERSSGGSCARLSPGDRRELERFFGDDAFRRRWTAYEPCVAAASADPDLFSVTFTDGRTVRKALDLPYGSPSRPRCDAGLRASVVEIGETLVKRYFP